MKDISVVLKYIPFAFTALIPVINPIGSALLLLGLVPNADQRTMKVLARKIAINTIWFLLVVQITGAYVLRFFGISLAVVQVAGGFVLATMGWALLNKQDPEVNTSSPVATSPESLRDKIFYPFTFPITAGPGCIVVALTLSAHAYKPSLLETGLAHIGLLLGTVLIGVVVYFSYAYAGRMRAKLSPAFTVGILRVISFILLCIGAEIMWNGVQSLLKTVS